MTFITIATVGYQEVIPLGPEGRAFTIVVIAFSGVTLAYTIGTLGQFFIEGELREILGRRKMDKRIQRMKDHYIIAGDGRVGQIVQHEFDGAGVRYVVIEKAPDDPSRRAARSRAFMEGDATEDEALLAAGIRNARGLICTIPSEADAVFIALTAKQLNPEIFIIARADSKATEKKLRRAGADRVVLPHETGGRHMAQVSLKPNVVDSLSIESFGGELGLQIDEVRIPPACDLDGKTLLDSELLSKHGVTVIAIRKSDGSKRLNPRPDTVIEAGDILVLVGEKGSLDHLDLSSGQS
jgi:voltage-gated potassium channel